MPQGFPLGEGHLSTAYMNYPNNANHSGHFYSRVGAMGDHSGTSVDADGTLTSAVETLSRAAAILSEFNQQIATNDDVLTRLQNEMSTAAASEEGSERAFVAHKLCLQEEIAAIAARTDTLRAQLEGSVYGAWCEHYGVIGDAKQNSHLLPTSSHSFGGALSTTTKSGGSSTLNSNGGPSAFPITNHRGTAFVPRSAFDALMAKKAAKEKALAAAESDLRRLAVLYTEGLKNDGGVQQQNTTAKNGTGGNAELLASLQAYINAFIIGEKK